MHRTVTDFLKSRIEFSLHLRRNIMIFVMFLYLANSHVWLWLWLWLAMFNFVAVVFHLWDVRHSVSSSPHTSLTNISLFNEYPKLSGGAFTQRTPYGSNRQAQFLFGQPEQLGYVFFFRSAHLITNITYFIRQLHLGSQNPGYHQEFSSSAVRLKQWS